MNPLLGLFPFLPMANSFQVYVSYALTFCDTFFNLLFSQFSNFITEKQFYKRIHYNGFKSHFKEKITDHFPTIPRHRLMTKNLGESKVSGEIYQHILYPKNQIEHDAIIEYIGTRNQVIGSYRQFDAKHHCFVSFYKHLQKIMAEQKKLDSPTQDEDTITKNCDRNNATTIVTQSQVGEKNNANHKATNNIGSSGHINENGLRRSPQVKDTRIKIDDIDCSGSDVSKDRYDNDDNYIVNCC